MSERQVKNYRLLKRLFFWVLRNFVARTIRFPDFRIQYISQDRDVGRGKLDKRWDCKGFSYRTQFYISQIF